MKQGSKHFRRPRGISSKKLKQLRQINNISTFSYTVMVSIIQLSFFVTHHEGKKKTREKNRPNFQFSEISKQP